MRRTYYLLLALLALSSFSFAQHSVRDIMYMQGLPKLYNVLKTNTTITIDGKADEIQWKNSPWTDEFVDIEGNHKNTPLYSTKVKMLWDDDNLYIYAQLKEPHVWGDLTQHDAIIYHNNDFEIFIKPYENQTNYYEIKVNTLNTILDLMLNKPYKHGVKLYYNGI